jgi:hypothetical protein
MPRKALGAASEKLLNILDGHSKDLPASKRAANWRALEEVVTMIDTRAKSQGSSKTPRIRRAVRKPA